MSIGLRDVRNKNWIIKEAPATKITKVTQCNYAFIWIWLGFVLVEYSKK